MPATDPTPPAVGEIRGEPLLGSLRWMWRDRLQFYTSLARRPEPILRFFIGPLPLYFVNAPTAIREVLLHDAEDFRKGFGNHVLRPLIGQGLFLAEGDPWSRRRKLVQPLFRQANLERMGDIAAQAVAPLRERWLGYARTGQIFDAYRELRELTLQIISRGLVGVDLFVKPEARALIERLWRETNARLDAPWLPFLPLPRNRRFAADRAALHAAIDHAIATHPAGAGDDLLSRLREARDPQGKPLAAQELRDEVVTFLLAGHECTSIALSWCLHCLSGHPTIDAELHQQLSSPQLSSPTDASPARAQSPLLRAVLSETIRLYPPAWIMGRQTNRALHIADCALAKDAILIICPYALHRRPDLYPEPEKFRPERFLQGPRVDRFAYLPFGAGPRTCIGMGLALQLAQVILTSLLSELRFEGEQPDVTPEPGLTLRPQPGLLGRVVRRSPLGTEPRLGQAERSR